MSGDIESIQACSKASEFYKAFIQTPGSKKRDKEFMDDLCEYQVEVKRMDDRVGYVASSPRMPGVGVCGVTAFNTLVEMGKFIRFNKQYDECVGGGMMGKPWVQKLWESTRAYRKWRGGMW